MKKIVREAFRSVEREEAKRQFEESGISEWLVKSLSESRLFKSLVVDIMNIM